MSPENFTYWLQGFFEISGKTKLKEQQVEIVRDHLDLVLKKTAKKNDISLLSGVIPKNEKILYC